MLENKDGAGGNSDGKEPLIKQQKPQLKKKWYKNPKTLAAIAVGNAVLIGAAAFSFGGVCSTNNWKRLTSAVFADVAASIGNLPVIGALGFVCFGGELVSKPPVLRSDGIGGILGGECCGDCCGSCECDCDCDCGDCLAC